MIEHATILSPDTRRSRIVEMLERDGEQSIDELAECFGVSGMTIRRDLQELATRGDVLRTHGGAAPAGRVSFEFGFLDRAEQNAAEKAAIAETAASLVGEGDSVLLDSGTTTLAIARRLAQGPARTVVTTSLPIASEFYGRPDWEVILLGGVLRSDSPDLVGTLTDNNLAMIRADVAFIGADAIDTKGYVYNKSADVGRMLKRMAAAADRTYVVADHTKLGQHELMRFGNASSWDGLVTDAGVERPTKSALAKAGVRVISNKKGAVRG